MAKHFLLIPRKNNMNPCVSCHFAKQKKFPFSNSLTHTYASFEVLHVDLWSPFATDSIIDHIYFLTLVDDFSRFTWVIFLKAKSEIKHKCNTFYCLNKKINSKPLLNALGQIMVQSSFSFPKA